MTPKFQLAELEIKPILTSLRIGSLTAAAVPELINDAISDPDPSNMFMRMFYILQTLAQREPALDMQAKALSLRSIYRIMAPSRPEIRLLAIMGPGDMIDNIPLEFIIDNAGIRLDLLFLSPDQPLPTVIPDHDVAIVSFSESDRNRPLLARMEKLYASWPRPILNRPDHIVRCARDIACKLLSDIPELHVPTTQRIQPDAAIEMAFPVTIRPVGSHAGRGFAKLDSTADFRAYLKAFASPEYYISPYIDYRSEDGSFRKYRIVLIDGRPFLCHLAISDHWMVHYHAAKMTECAEKRREEAEVMQNFDSDFARRHGKALSLISDRLGLEYVVLDCAEMPDGRLLLFEVDIAAWVHATDREEFFSYKAITMQKAFDAFKNLLKKVIHQ